MWKLRKNWLIILAMIGLGLLGAAAPAQAQNLDFVIAPLHPATASISFSGALGAPLIGMDLNVTSFASTLTPGGVFPITGGDLDFTTGGFTGASGNEWLFAGGGTFTITGTVPLIPGATGTLVSGSFGAVSVTQLVPGNTFLVQIATVIDDKHDAIEAHFFPGVDEALITWDGRLALSFIVSQAGLLPGDAFSTPTPLTASGDFVNTPSVIPEPSSIALLGMGAFSLAGYGWRRVKARRAAA